MERDYNKNRNISAFSTFYKQKIALSDESQCAPIYSSIIRFNTLRMKKLLTANLLLGSLVGMMSLVRLIKDSLEVHVGT